MKRRVLVGDAPDYLRRKALTARVAHWEDGLRTDAGPGTNEWWYFDADFEDGSTAVIIFHTKGGPMDLRRPLAPMVRITITDPSRREYREETAYEAPHFVAAKDKCDVRIGPSWMRGDLYRYELHAETGALSADLEFTGVAPPWRCGTGENYFDESLSRYFGWLAAIPCGTVTGTITYGGRTVQVRGEGYHDHNWMNVNMASVFRYWYWGRANAGPYTAIFRHVVAAKKYNFQRISHFMLTRGSELLAGDGRPLKVETSRFRGPPRAAHHPKDIAFHWHSNTDSVHVGLRRGRLIESIDILKLLPPWIGIPLRLIMRPYYFRYEAEVELHAQIGDTDDRVKGTGIYELFIFR